jgi:hypothetical protein
MIRAALLLLLAPLAANAQLQLILVNGAQQTPLTSGSTYSLGQIAAGASEDFVVRALNNGTAPISIAANNPALSGSGNFSITSPPPNSQPNIAPGSFLDFYIHFAGGSPASYTANFQLNGIVVHFAITSVPSATVTAASPCTGLGSTNTVNFGNIAEGQKVSCMFQLQNLSSQQLTVSSISATGAGFLISQPAATPLNLPVGASASFTVTFAPNTAASFTGTLTVDTQMVVLTGTAYIPPLPTPTLEFDTKTPQNGQQVTLSMTIPTPAPVAASGSINLVFQPDPSVAGLRSGDPTVMFVANGARSVPFSFPPGATQATFGGQTGAVFQTGTTTGKITFTVTITSGVQFSGDPTTSLALAPLPVQIDNAAATAIAGSLSIQVWGFDNTYSTGAMSFTFYDNLGNPIGAGPIPADFTSAFLNYFATSNDGSAFQMLVSFPVTGNAAEVGSVSVQLTNSAGTATITQLMFRNDTGRCVLTGNVLSCPPASTH